MMENPGLRRHGQSMTGDLYQPGNTGPQTMNTLVPGGIEPLDQTDTEDVEQAPPPTGRGGIPPVGDANGDAGSGPLAMRQGAQIPNTPAVNSLNQAANPVRANQLQPNGLPLGQVPSPARQQQINDQQQQAWTAENNLNTQLKQPGGGSSGANPAHTMAEDSIKGRAQMEGRSVVSDYRRKTAAKLDHPLHQAAQDPNDFYDDLYGGGSSSEEGPGRNGMRWFSIDPIHPDDTHQISVGVRRGPDTSFEGDEKHNLGLRHGFEYTIAHNGEPLFHSNSSSPTYFKGPVRDAHPDYDEHDAAGDIPDSIATDVSFARDEPEEFGGNIEDYYPDHVRDFINQHYDRLRTDGYKDRVHEI